MPWRYIVTHNKMKMLKKESTQGTPTSTIFICFGSCIPKDKIRTL